MIDFSDYRFFEYEGWVGIYKEGKFVTETDDFRGWLERQLNLDVDYDSAYEWFDTFGAFPRALP